MLHRGVKGKKKKKDGKTWQVPQSPTRCPGWLQHRWPLWLLFPPWAEPSIPHQKMGSSKAGEGSRKANQGVQRDF